jgi:adenylate cyclase
MRAFLQEIRRRKVWQVLLIYVAVGWLLVQVGDTLFPMFNAPQWVLQAFTVLLALGLPVALILAWAYDLTPSGVKREAPRIEADDQSDQPASSSDQRSWIAVMPLKAYTEDSEVAQLAEGLTDSICAGLARFSYLAVVARESVAGKAAEIVDVREFSRALGARYVIEGGVRRSGGSVRVSLRLIEAAGGVSLWAENYTRNLENQDLFAAEDEISDKVVATLADSFGVLVGALTRPAGEKPQDERTPNDWVLLTFDYLHRYLPVQHGKLRDGLEKAVERFPRHAELRACLAHVYLNEYNFGFNPRPDPLDRALQAAEKALDLDGASQLANQQLAQVYFFRREVDRFRSTAERAIDINALDTHSLSILGLLYVHLRDFEHGTRITQRAMDLNSNYAHWCHFSWIWYHCARGEYEQALERVNRVNISGNFWIPLATAAICVQLGRDAEAREAVAQILALDPDFDRHGRADIEAWHYASGLGDLLMDSLEKAGLKLDGNG